QLRDSLASTVVSLTSIPEYQTQAVVDTTSSLRRSSPAVDQLLETIKVLLLGQDRLGEGLPALDVPLAGPSALVDDGAGGFLIAEERPGRLRQVSAAGVLTTYMDRMQGRYKFNMGAISDVFRTSEGALYLAGTQTQGHGVHRLSPDGTLTQLVGTQARGRSTVGASALASEACPESLWVDRDGTLWFGEDGKVAGGVRVLSVGADGIVREPAPALPAWGDAKVVGLVRGSDGALYALIGITGAKGQIARLAPGETQWKKFAEVEETGSFGDLANAPDGGLWVALDRSGRLLWLGLDKKRRVVLDRAANSPIGKPCDLLPQPDGSVLVIDADTSLVHRVTREGQTSLLAGLDPKRPFDPAKGVALNVPQGLALDAQGRLLIAEMGGNAVQAWKDGNLTRLSGGVMGGTTATQTLDLARFNGPNALLARNGLLYVVDRLNFAVRVIDEAAGEVRVLAKNSAPVPMRLSAGQTLAPNAVNLLDCFGFTAASQGPFYFSAVYRNQVVRLQETGQAQLLAGSGEKGDAGDGGPADQAQLERPGGLGVTPQGDLLITDVGNFRVRRVLQPQGNAPRIEAFMGVPLAQSIGRLSASYAGADEGKPATEVAMAAPAALCYDPEGNLYVAELGTVYSHALFNLPGGAPLIDFSTLPVVPARIRRVDREGRVTTLVGPGGRFLTDPTAVDALVLPTSLLVDGQGRLVVADAGANLVRFFPLRAIP
ncbi:MAG: hypothetical protein VKP62_12010, partial [Candidatus Sericytochromatia bacterium]|nr:hypothetical protein [Candidatus Sericytochromatia bacterium]